MTHGRQVRVLIVDDSAVMRSLLRSVLGTDKRLETVATASDGAAALRAMEALRPDLVLLDVEMPVMDGLATLRQMRVKGLRMPVIMCSTLTQRGAQVTIEALAQGAADYVAKPAGQPSREAAVESLAHHLVPRILALTGAAQAAMPGGGGVFAQAGPAVGSASGKMAGGTVSGAAALMPHAPVYSQGAHLPPVKLTGIAAQPMVLAIGVSTGGPAALDVLLPSLPVSFPLPVLVVQHMPELFTKLLAERLDTRCALRVREASHGDPVRPGNIYIARGNWHMEVAGSPTNVSLRLNQDAAENHCRPAVDVLFRTAVGVWGSGVLGVILTGMGSDGFLGCRLIRDHGGAVLAQDQATSAVWGMPGVVTTAGLAHKVLPLPAIAPEILRLAGRGQREAMELREAVVGRC